MTLAEAHRISALVQTAYALPKLKDPTTVPMPDGFAFVDYLVADDFGLGLSPFGILAMDLTTQEMVEALRGTEGWQDILRDLQAKFDGSPFGPATGRVEYGFSRVYASLRRASGAPICSVKKAVFHSLGCPVGTYHLAAQGGVDLCLLASPEPGDAVFSQWALQQFSGVLNIQNPHDVVPDAPGRFLGYRDMGSITHLPFGHPFPITVQQAEDNHALINYRAALKVVAEASSIPSKAAA